MKTLILCVPPLLIAWSPLAPQEPPTPADSETVRRAEQRQRQSAIDSLRAGRHRWRSARIVEYRLETSFGCFCVPDPADSLRGSEVFTIRDGRITHRSPGKGSDSYVPNTSWTVDSLFDIVETDVENNWRRVRRLELHPVYGFPLRYTGEGVKYEDAWIEITVDSFAVVRTASRSNRRRPRKPVQPFRPTNTTRQIRPPRSSEM